MGRRSQRHSVIKDLFIQSTGTWNVHVGALKAGKENFGISSSICVIFGEQFPRKAVAQAGRG